MQSTQSCFWQVFNVLCIVQWKWHSIIFLASVQCSMKICDQLCGKIMKFAAFKILFFLMNVYEQPVPVLPTQIFEALKDLLERSSTISRARPVQVLDDVSYFISFPKYGGGEIFKLLPHLQSHFAQKIFPSFVSQFRISKTYFLEFVFWRKQLLLRRKCQRFECEIWIFQFCEKSLFLQIPDSKVISVVLKKGISRWIHRFSSRRKFLNIRSAAKSDIPGYCQKITSDEEPAQTFCR